jgi:DNA (cytosine-5)-methyltransferase 1
VLDLFCYEGGASYGYHLAWPDAEIVGVDINAKAGKRYPFTFVEADAMTYPLDGFDVIHASPPCQDRSSLRTMHDGHGTGWMLAATIERLRTWGGTYIVENVPGPVLEVGPADVLLCGSSFGLKVRRHREFWTSFLVLQQPCRHKEQGTPIGVYGTGGGGQMTRGYKGTPAERREAMGIDWMSNAGIAQAIPPAYTRYLAEQF